MKQLLVSTLFMCFVGFLAVAQAQQPSIDEGIEYQRVVPPQPTETGDKVEVLELFWYGCPHCYHFEPLLDKWLQMKPANVEFRRMPAIFSNPTWELHARAYYAAEALGVLDKIHRPLFDALHTQNRDLSTEAALMAFFAEHGVSNEDFQRAFNSFYVRNKTNQAKVLTDRYGIEGVPTIIVNGKYRTGGTSAGTLEDALNVVNYLIKKETQG
jgi:thiol:disulfide interchange protein DsbA